MKIDLHTHILPPGWPDLAARFGGKGWPRLEFTAPGCGQIVIDTQRFRDIEDNTWNPERRIEECDRAGVTMQVLSTVPVMFSYWAPGEQAYTLSRLLNDHIASVVDKHPTRFVGLGTVPLQAPDLAIREMERCVRDLRMPGVMIGTHANEWNLDEPALIPFFERAVELDASIFVHPWDMLGRDRMTRFMLPWLVGMPAETALAMSSLIFSGLLDRLPNLRIGFAHGGGAFPMCIGRYDRGFAGRPDLCAVSIEKPPSQYVRRLYIDSLVHDPSVLRFLIDLFGADRIALGTDYPFPLGEAVPGKLIESMDLDPDTRDQLLWRTAAEFLKLRIPAHAADA